MAAFDPIPAFNDQLHFPDAYGWNSATILNWLKGVAANPAAYGAQANRQADFQLLYNSINDLRVGGPRYNQPKPEQQYLRKGNPPEVDETNPIRWTVNTHAERYFIMFDLLGIFISLMGQAPAKATAKNFFLPLVVIYARWCRALARGTNPPARPTVTQITWASKGSGKPWYYFLGASSAGFNKNPKTLKEIVGRARHGYLHNILQAPWTEFGRSPSRDRNSNAGTNFGNCAETYPFLYILGDPELKRNSSGIAFEVASANHPTYNGSDYWERGPMMPPCDPNCRRLMDWYDVLNRLDNFEQYLQP